VVFDGPRSLTGTLVQVVIYDVSPHTLWGVVAAPHAASALTPLG